MDVEMREEYIEIGYSKQQSPSAHSYKVLRSDTKRVEENECKSIGRSVRTVQIPKFRSYDMETSIAVRKHYKTMRENQTITHVKHCAEKYSGMKTRMTPWAAVELMETFVDISDPDINLPQVTHLLQTAESIRAEGLPDWFQLVGFIHDLGKMMYLKGCDADGSSLREQWSIVGDTFVVGAPLPDTLVYPEFNTLNQDCDLDVYPDGIGLMNVHIAYGHDEYLYQVLAQAQDVKLPAEGLYAIRFHSLYPWHKHGEYSRLEDSTDRKMKHWVLLLNQHDLYSKDKLDYTDTKKEELLLYYRGLMEKYLPAELLW